jgi:RNA polymerase sigma factor for flagellar operon FliA
MNMPREKLLDTIVDKTAKRKKSATRSKVAANSKVASVKSKKNAAPARSRCAPRQELAIVEQELEEQEYWNPEEQMHLDDLACQYKNAAADIKDMMPWVKAIAQKIHRPLPACVLLGDLIQDGMIGLIMAFREHRPDSGIPFHVYAGNKIRWAIMDGLRAGDWAGKSVRRRANKITRTMEKLQGMLHRKPTNSEIAHELGVRAEDVATTFTEAYGYSFVRINDMVDGETYDIPDSRSEPSAVAEHREVYAMAMDAMRLLQPNERKVLILRIICEMNGQQAATEMGLTESRVSQLFKAATKKLAGQISH